MNKQFVIVKRLGFIHIHVDCSSSRKSVQICDYIDLCTPVDVWAFSFSRETQSVIVVGKTTAPISDEELNELVENAMQTIV